MLWFDPPFFLSHLYIQSLPLQTEDDFQQVFLSLSLQYRDSFIALEGNSSRHTPKYLVACILCHAIHI